MCTHSIHLALASDDNYFEGLLTTAWSAARNCSRPARQISAWRSMRMANGIGDILLCRALFLVAASGNLGQWIMKRLLALRGKSDSWSIIEAYTRPFILPNDFNRKLLP